MPDWVEAIKRAHQGVTLELDIVPGARESRFPAGFNAWRGRLEAKVQALPEDGQANAALCRLVADALGVPLAGVRVTAGHTSRRKSVFVAGLTLEQATARLAGPMGS